MNLSVSVNRPKKDKCDYCVDYQAKKLSEDYTLHTIKKNEEREAIETDS